MDAYLSDLYWAQEYAARNRAVMSHGEVVVQVWVAVTW
jgi:hypothetical protein